MELMTMATHTLPASAILDDEDAPATAHAGSRKSILRRIYDALIESQTRRAHREIDRVLGAGAFRRALRTDLSTGR
jgi:hypothetical protein